MPAENIYVESLTIHVRSRGSSVSIGYGLDDRGSVPDRGNDRIFSLRNRLQTDSGVHPASLIKMATGVKAAGV
jgi:hypothetical protein